jgi:transcription termination/antitermination protein NusG
MTDFSHSALASDGWFVVWTESRAEKKVASRIASQGIEPWVPTVTERHRWSDRWRDVVLPLFPGYLFVRGSSTRLHQVLRTPGVLTVVKNGGAPAILTDSFIASLRQAIERSGVAAQPVEMPHDYDVNDEIIVQEGPLAGLRGVVRQLRGARHLVVWVKEVGRGVAFTIGASLVAKADR